MHATQSEARRPDVRRLAWSGLWLGGALAAAPTLLTIAQRSWSTDQGQYGAVALAIGLYLLAESALTDKRPHDRPRPLATLILFGCGAALYLLGRVSSEYVLESYGLFGLLLAGVHALTGGGGLRSGAFALTFILFSLPLPVGVLVPVSSLLRAFIVSQAEGLLRLSGMVVARDGISLFIDGHQIDIRQACSGMNSLISLTLIGLAYLHLRRRPPPAYLLFMTPAVFAFAIVANLCRVLVVALLTQSFGEAVGQGLLHETAGLAAFAAALGLVIGLDAAIGARWSRGARG